MHSFFFNDTSTSEIYTLSLHDALPIFRQRHLGDVQLVLGDQSEQQVERSLEDVEVHLEGARAVRRIARLAGGEVAIHRAAERCCAHVNDGTASSSLSWLALFWLTGCWLAGSWLVSPWPTA